MLGSRLLESEFLEFIERYSFLLILILFLLFLFIFVVVRVCLFCFGFFVIYSFIYLFRVFCGVGRFLLGFGRISVNFSNFR